MRRYAVLALAALLTACGGGGGSGGSTTNLATGYFKDSNTEGLRYVSGAQTGTTGQDGSFTYEVGRPIYFYIGAGTNVPLGSATGQAVITPVDLVSNGTTSHQAVQNMVRLLMVLDSDGNPDNGIKIAPAVQAAAANWSAVTFDQATNTFAGDSNVVSIVAAANVANGGTSYSLQTATTAQSHLEATLRCARSGGFKGTYSGSDHGPVGVMVDATTGVVTGYFNSAVTPSYPPGTISGSTATTLNQSGSFSVVSGGASFGTTFDGHYDSPNVLVGSWAQGTGSGTFAMNRIGGQANAAYRFTGKFLGTGYGLFTFDVDTIGGVNGVAYDVTSDALLTLSGNVTGTMLTGTASNGTQITGTLNTSTGALSGSWTNTALGASGTYSGGGCKLN